MSHVICGGEERRVGIWWGNQDILNNLETLVGNWGGGKGGNYEKGIQEIG
jgi:hypothetical protein